MAYTWHFRRKHKGDDIANPISGEFFADGSLDNPGVALVREALQNAVDAGRAVDRGSDPVRVRFALHRGPHALPAAAAAHWFVGLRSHLNAKGNGLKDVPPPDEDCEYLVVEDFGTTGLTGDTAADSVEGQQNNFVDFLRGDGLTRKHAGDGGSWGVGKNVFPRSSRINGFLAYTVRRDDGQRLLMGKSIMKIRAVGRYEYQPACYLGASWDDGEVPRAFTNPDVLARAEHDFRLGRGDQPGLSLVVPYVDPDVKYDDLVNAVVTEYAFAILNGSLHVTLADGDTEVTFTRDNVVEHVRTLLPSNAPIVELAQWALSVGDGDRQTLTAPPADGPQKWDASLLPEAVKTTIAVRLAEGERVAVRVPVYVRGAATAAAELSHFDLFLEPDESTRASRPRFFRERLAISGVKRALGIHGVRGLVTIDDKPLADLLRAAEPPNHTDWDPKTANFRKAYRDGNHVIAFVKSAVTQVVGICRTGDDKPDLNITKDFFSVPEPGKQAKVAAAGGKRKPGVKPVPPVDPPPVKPPRFRIATVDGGFVIRPGAAGTAPPKRLKIVMAYDVFSGSPFNQYDEADFDLNRRDRSGISIITSGGASAEVVDHNRLAVALTGVPFEVYVTGFDTNRDLIVRAYDPREPIDADPTPELHEPAEADA